MNQDLITTFKGITTEADARRQAELSSLTIIAGAITTFLLFLTFLLHWWVGENWANLAAWTSEESMYGLTALTMALTIGALEYKLSSVVIVTRVMLFSRLLLLAFLLTGESANTVNREDARVHQASQSSPVFKATVDSIKAASVAAATASSQVSPAALAAAGDKASWESRAKNCKTTACTQEASRKIAQADAKLSADSAARDAGSSASAQAIGTLVSSANTMAYDERHHSAITKIFARWFGVDSLKIALFIAVLGMAAVNLALFSVGRSMAIEKGALSSGSYSPADFAGGGAISGTVTQQAHAAATTNQQAALNTIWAAIDAGEITSISLHDNGDVATLLKDRGHGTTNESRRKLMEFAMDALLRENVINANPEYVEGAQNGKRPKYMINQNRVIKYKK